MCVCVCVFVCVRGVVLWVCCVLGVMCEKKGEERKKGAGGGEDAK